MAFACPAFLAENFPDACRVIDVYCERTSDALDAEPLNAISGLAMLVSAGAAWRLMRRYSNAGSAGLIYASMIAIAIGAFGAALFHTTAMIWTVWVDMFPFLVFMLLILWLTLTRFFGWPALAAAVAVAAFLAVTFGAGPFVRGILPFALYYVTPLVVLAVSAAALVRNRSAAASAYALATAVFLGAIVARELDGPLCSELPTGIHFVWHLLTALLAYLLLRAAILYAPPPLSRGGQAPQSGPARPSA